MTISKKRIKEFAGVFFKGLLVIASFSYLYFELNKLDEPGKMFVEFFSELSLKEIVVIIPVVLLIPANWSIETIKWRFLISTVEKLSFFKAFRAVISGISLSFFTPNRSGEWLGRVLILQKGNKVPAIPVSLVGSLSQLISTLLFGIVGLFLFSFLKPDIVHRFHFLFTPAARYIAFGILLAFILFVINIKKIISLLLSKPFFKKISKYLKALEALSPKRIWIVILLSLSRYCVFCTQFILLLIFFQADIQLMEAIAGITVSYLILSFIPSFTLAEIGIRGSVSIAVLGIFTTQSMAIFSASFFLWILNIILPGIIGAIVFPKLKF